MADTLRPLEAGDRDDVVELFWATLALGRRAPISPSTPVAGAYGGFCLDWFLDAGLHDGAAVVDSGGDLVAYALVCTDVTAYERWVRRRLPKLATAVARAGLAGHIAPTTRTFLRHRIRDAAVLARSNRHVGAPAIAHVNVRDGARRATVARLLRGHIDTVVARAGHDTWVGEINAAAGRRARALERAGFELVGRDPNHTLTWMLDRPVERLTVRRQVPDRPAPGQSGAPLVVPLGRSYL